MAYDIKEPEEINDDMFVYFHPEDIHKPVYKVRWGKIKEYLAKAFRPKYRYLVVAKLYSSITPNEIIGECVGEYEAADENEAIEQFKEVHKYESNMGITCRKIQ